jgi:acyl-[acyl-carrier-protein]-phospholipid O-acyltransferase / long-chain-fatty-acid--[acyl-carrier-protein] ligase
LRNIHEEMWRLFFKFYFRTFHRIRIEGLDRIPRHYEKLILIANHASYLDGVIIWTYLRLPFKIIVDRDIVLKPWLKPFLKNDNIVPIDSMNPYALKEVIRTVNDGFPLLVFPEGRRTSTGNIMKIYDGAGFVAYRTGADILPIYIKNTYNTLFARKHGGRHIFAKVTVTIGQTQKGINLDHMANKRRKKEATRTLYRLLCEVCLEAHNRPSTLGREFVRICKENGKRLALSDSTGARVSYKKSLIGAFALGRFVCRATKDTEKTIGVLLPNLSVTAMLFIGLQLFRKVPALLNYTSGPVALRQALELADIDTVITSRQFLERIRLSTNVFGVRHLLFLEDLKQRIGPQDKALAFFNALFPGHFQRMTPGDEKASACILFTSGSEGVPKGVPLSHENIITNIYQGLSRVDVSREDYFLNVLPIFHSFGLTAGTILPLFGNAKIFFHVSPLHYRIVPELAYVNECTILLATNTFLAGYARRGNAYDFRSMRYIFCGGEALSESVFQHYARIFGIRVISGYGTTECSPIISMNSAVQNEYGTVGTILPGMEYRLVPVEGIDDKGGTVGRFFVRGGNVMKGYLKNEKANHKYLVEDKGWYDTGDVIEITEDGFLRIVGRLKRFAKVSGEMISLAAVEEALIRELGGRKDIAVMAIKDAVKGERLVIITNNSQLGSKEVRGLLRGQGFSDLAVPGDVRFVKEIPKLGTGKIDYLALQQMLRP